MNTSQRILITSCLTGLISCASAATINNAGFKHVIEPISWSYNATSSNHNPDFIAQVINFSNNDIHVHYVGNDELVPTQQFLTITNKESASLKIQIYAADDTTLLWSSPGYIQNDACIKVTSGQITSVPCWNQSLSAVTD